MTRQWPVLALPDNAAGFREVSDRVETLVEALREAFSAAEETRLMLELLQEDERISRAVLQFSVSPELFDHVFNSYHGYRGMYRIGPWVGSSVNALICREIVGALGERLPATFPAWVVRWGPAVDGHIEVEKGAFLASLDPALSKLWYATTAISASGTLRLLPFGTTTEAIEVGTPAPWRVLAQQVGEAYLEIKGAFRAPHGLFQQKAPEVRAFGLSRSGQA